MARSDPLDTSEEARDLQFELWRQMTPTERARISDELSNAADLAARAGIRDQHDPVSEVEMLWHLAFRRYGRQTADATFGGEFSGR